MFKSMEPAIEQARSNYPEARRRFLAGLPNGTTFYVTTRLHDERGKVEQVFITVDTIERGMVTGRIANAIGTVTGYSEGQVHRFPETDVLDWTIAHPDGTEEGNFIGKFLDAQEGIKH